MNDIIGKVFGRYTIIEELPHRIYIKPNGKERKVRIVKCRCICGNENNVVYNNLLNGTSKSCGCLHKELMKNSNTLFTSEKLIGNTYRLGIKHTEETKNKLRGIRFKRKLDNRELIQQIRSTDKYKKWRLEVFNRDGFICRISLQKSNRDLEAHHIINIYKLVKIYNISSIEDAYNCEELWDVNNGITLNKIIHKMFHNKYGQYNNTLEQLEEFKKLIA